MAAAELIELWRGGMLESTHRGHVVVCDDTGQVVACWGDPDRAIFPRSSCKMLQALPLVESGAADGFGLSERHLALSCASHSGATLHRDMVEEWLATLDLSESDLRCGAHMPYDPEAQRQLIRAGQQPCQCHNNCSGKHSGFLTMNKHLKGGSEYVDADHPVQLAVRAAFEEVTEESSPGYGIDGCSAPNFMTSLTALARAMASFAKASDAGNRRQRAQARLRDAMRRHPELVAGEGRATTELMRAMDGKATIKSGAEGVFVAILPDQKLGIALKIEDGNSRASEAAITALLHRFGPLDPAHPVAQKRLPSPQRNCRGMAVTELRLAAGFA